MVDQATMNANGSARRLGRNLSDFAHDVVTLAELQLQLLSVDLRDTRATAVPSAIMLCSGLIFAFGTIPLLLAAIAFLLVEFAGWTYSAAFGLVALASITIAGLLAWFGWTRLMAALSVLKRSRDELRETMHWVKESLRTASSAEQRAGQTAVGPRDWSPGT
jgi:uncharacterized membrane protein YqjE